MLNKTPTKAPKTSKTSKTQKIKQLGVIGCGLMGGSFALALKEAGLVEHVLGYSPDAASLAEALQKGAIDAVAPSALAAAQNSSVVLVAVPVAATEATLTAIAPSITAQTLVMDVGSTKTNVVQAAQVALSSKELGSFVPAHPITGKERAGAAYADALLYQGARVVLTPTEHTQDGHIEQASNLWLALGCRIVECMSPQAHDAALAAVSHAPHVFAFAMMRSLAAQEQGQRYLAMAGPGLRDFSRIAGSDPQIWRDILMSNRCEVLEQIRRYRRALDEFEIALERAQPQLLEQMIAQASTSRSQRFA